MKLDTMVGFKLFRKLDNDEIDMIRITGLKKYIGINQPEEPYRMVSIIHEGSGEKERVQYRDLKNYTPLEPNGIITFNTVTVQGKDMTISEDVIVTASKFLNLKIKDTLPYAVCRQNITDIFYNLLCKDESDMMVGLSVNRDTCPANFNYLITLSCKDITHTDFINFYRLDTIDDILQMIDTTTYDLLLNKSYQEHVKATGNMNLLFKKQDKGWCKDLKTLLHENNFQEDINQMLGITDMNFVISNYLVPRKYNNGVEFYSLREDLVHWLSSIFKLNITNTTILEYNHDIDLAEFNQVKYLLIRDKLKKLYILVYINEGEYQEIDLQEGLKKPSFSDEFRINFYNKYNLNK